MALMTKSYHLAHKMIKEHVNAGDDDLIITAGFGEVKNEDRQNQNKELINIAEKGGLIFVGPNSMGIYTSEDNASPLHLGFGFMIPRPGKISIVSQSGTMGTLTCNALKYIRLNLIFNAECQIKYHI